MYDSDLCITLYKDDDRVGVVSCVVGCWCHTVSPATYIDSLARHWTVTVVDNL